MSDVDKMLGEIDRFIPAEGANLVGYDDFEPPGDRLYLVGHFPNEAEAEAEKTRRLADDPDRVFYVYTPKMKKTGRAS